MPENNLKIAIIPHDIIENDAAANLAAVEKRLSAVDSDTDLIVLPEMFNTGYANSRQQLLQNAETDDGVTMQASLRSLSKNSQEPSPSGVPHQM